jgi:2-phospho-L-lactate transferase/gluconeogenesis factor (CofD/UPF0052 family)
MADDGGSSGRLRRELGVLPPGDVRKTLLAHRPGLAVGRVLELIPVHVVFRIGPG